MIDKQEIIIRFFRNGESISRISRETQISRKTVRKYIKNYSEAKKRLSDSRQINEKELIEEIVKTPKYDSSNRPKRKVSDEIVSAVKSCLEKNKEKRSRGQHKQQMKKIDIFEYLTEIGYQIGYATICKLVNRLEQKRSEAFIKQKYKPGDVCEFDWGEVKIFIDGKLRRFQLAVFTSAYGNYRYSYLFPRQNTQCFQEAHALFFAQIGGVYRTMVYDNMKVAVRKFVGLTRKEATDGLLKLSTYYNFDFRFCNIRSGNEKGHVERSVEYVRRKAFSRRDDFISLEEANEYLLSVCENLNDKPQKGNKNQTAKAIFRDERDFLLPALPEFECATLSELRVDKYSTINVENSHYSVPEKYTGKMITAKIYSDEIICYYENQKICDHRKSYYLGEWFIKVEHYLESLKRKPGAVVGSIAFVQMNEELKTIYRNYFSSQTKDFIELLIYMKENQKSIADIQKIINKLLRISPTHISTAKIKSISERNIYEEKIDYSTKIDEFSKEQLSILSQLIPQKNISFTSGEIL